MEPESQKISVKYQQLNLDFKFSKAQTLQNLRDELFKVTGVAPPDQKLLGLKEKSDEKTFAELRLKPHHKFQVSV